MGVSSLSKAISQKPSGQDSNSQPSDHKSGTPTTRPRTHPMSLSLGIFYSASIGLIYFRTESNDWNQLISIFEQSIGLAKLVYSKYEKR